MIGFKVCRFRELIKGDQFLDPRTGEVVRLESSAADPKRARYLIADITTVTTHTRGNLTLHGGRWMRRKLREGEHEQNDNTTAK